MYNKLQGDSFKLTNLKPLFGLYGGNFFENIL